MTCGPTSRRRCPRGDGLGSPGPAIPARNVGAILLECLRIWNEWLPRTVSSGRRPRPVRPLVLDDAQRRVVAHAGGPLLVLAGPGTGKTTTIVEAAAERITGRGIDPSRLLVLTFSRKAARDLRERIALRLARTTRQPLALTFHSYAYALVRREYVLAGDEPPVLLTGPEQLLEVRRLLRGEAADGGRSWPERLRPALATRGFAAELRDFLLRATERGLDGRGLAALGRARGRGDWVAAGRFLDAYAARFDLAPVPAYDYSEIVRIAGGLLGRKAIRDRERDAWDAILVDEYQDTDPAQEEMLRQLAGDGRELIAVGDPDQSIYAFRGADVDAIRHFPERFRAGDGRPAPVLALRTCRRSGPALLAASRRVAARMPAPVAGSPVAGGPVAGSPVAGGPVVGGPVAAPGAGASRAGHRALVPLPGAPAGEIRVLTAASASQEAALIADTLRRAHLIDGLPWSAMAVLVRSAVRQVPVLQRALATAGVPVAVAGDELPLTAEPGTRPLLALLACALRPGALTEEAAAELLTGPLGGSDALGLRRLRRVLRAAAQAAGQPPPEQPLAAALADPRELAVAGWPAGRHDREAGPGGATGPEALAGLGAGRARERRRTVPALAAARRVAGLLALARERAEQGGTPHEVLWAVWDASGLAGAWQEASAAGGLRGAAADADLDAVVALFDAAARFSARLPHGSARLFLDSLTGQEIAGDSLAEQAPRGDAVAVLTAHRSKGLEWDLVVVAGVQEGTWPDLRQRGSLLGMDELVDAAAGRLAEPADAAAAALASKLLDEERRLFYVAVTRARRFLVVTAVGSAESEERPSRFLAELAGDQAGVEHVAATGRQWLSLPVLTASLRRAAADAGLPAAVRRAAAAQLARLAAAGVPGRRSPAVVRADRADQRRAARDPRRGAAVPVPGRAVHPVRAALAAGGGGRRRLARRGPRLRHRHPRRRRAGRRGSRRQRHHQAARRDVAAPGLRQRLVQRPAARAGRADGGPVPGLAPVQPARAGRRRGGTGRPGRERHDHRPGRSPGAGRRRHRHRGRPEDRQLPPGRGRAGPQPPARRLPAGRAAGGVRAPGADRAGRRRADPGRQRRPEGHGPGAAPARAGRGPRPRLGR